MIVSLKEAREILGEGDKDLSDEQLTELINNLDVLAREFIHAYMCGEFNPDDFKDKKGKKKNAKAK